MRKKRSTKKRIVFLLVAGAAIFAGKHFYFNETKEANERQNPNRSEAKAKNDSPPVTMLDRKEPTDGIHLYRQKQFHRAIAELEKAVENSQNTDRDRSLAYLAKCYEALDDDEKTRRTWRQLLAKFPESNYTGDAKYFLAKQKQKAGLLQSAEKLLREAAEAVGSVGGYRAALELAEKYEKERGKELELWKMYSTAIRFVDDRKRLFEILHRLNALVDELLYSSRQIPIAKFYTVQPGDNLTKIAAQYDTSVGFIKRINGKDSDMLRIGERLKIVPGSLWVEVRKSYFFLGIFLENGLFVRGYKVGLGRDDRTPEKVFRIATKLSKPDWWRDGRRIPYGDPDNLLGEYWLGFENDVEARGFGIHGTKDPDSIGKNMSDGCIRLRNHNLAELFAIVPRQTKVVVKRW